MSDVDGRGRRALVVGLGLSGVAAAETLAGVGWEVVAIDASDAVDADRLRSQGIDVRAPYTAAVDGVELVVKSPGVPGDAEPVAAARAAGVPIWSEVELATRLAPNPVLAITGTNGKTTTTELTAHLLRQAGIAAHACGNQGTPIARLIHEVPSDDWLVTECSSFQLEDVDRFHPRGAALLNLAPDHLDRHGTMEAYRSAKLRIFERMEAGDMAIAPRGTSATTRGVELRHVSRDGENGAIAWDDGQSLQLPAVGKVIDWDDAALRGRHNRENMMVAAALSHHAGAAVDAIRQGLVTFPGVRHRLEFVAEIDGVVFINDSKATNPDAAIAALEAYGPKVRLIAGGRDKGTPFSTLAVAAADGAVAAHLIGEAAPALAEAFAAAGLASTLHPDLDHAVQAARAAASPGEVVLLAPACASFDQFLSYEARGDAFCDAVGGL